MHVSPRWEARLDQQQLAHEFLRGAEEEIMHVGDGLAWILEMGPLKGNPNSETIYRNMTGEENITKGCRGPFFFL